MHSIIEKFKSYQINKKNKIKKLEKMQNICKAIFENHCLPLEQNQIV